MFSSVVAKQSSIQKILLAATNVTSRIYFADESTHQGAEGHLLVLHYIIYFMI